MKEDGAAIDGAARQSFTKQERLRHNSQFQETYLQGRKQQGPNLTLYYKPNQLLYNRLGLSISKKCLRLSSKRQSVRRCLREAFRINKQRFLCGYDWVVTLRKTSFLCLQKNVNPTVKKFQTIERELLYLAHKARLLQ